jgi:hypothetical protein
MPQLFVSDEPCATCCAAYARRTSSGDVLTYGNCINIPSMSGEYQYAGGGGASGSGDAGRSGVSSKVPAAPPWRMGLSTGIISSTLGRAAGASTGCVNHARISSAVSANAPCACFSDIVPVPGVVTVVLPVEFARTGTGTGTGGA